MKKEIQTNSFQHRVINARKLIELNLKDIDKQLKSSYRYSFLSGFFGLGSIVLNIVFIFWAFLINKMQFIFDMRIMPEANFEENVITGLYGMLVLSLGTFFFGILLLRHQKKLSNDIKYFLNKKLQIQLFANVLMASTFIVKHSDDEESIVFVQNVFTETSKQVFSGLVESPVANEEDNPVLIKLLEGVTSSVKQGDK